MFAELGDTLGDTLEFGPRVSPNHVVEIYEETDTRATRATKMARATVFSNKSNALVVARVGARQIGKPIWSAGPRFLSAPRLLDVETDHAQR